MKGFKLFKSNYMPLWQKGNYMQTVKRKVLSGGKVDLGRAQGIFDAV